MIESLLDWIQKHAKFIKARGTSGDWEYTEYADGTIEAYADISNNVNIDSGDSPVYYNSTAVEIDVPDFIAPEYVSVEWKNGGSGLIYPYLRIAGQKVMINYMRFYGGKANLTMLYRLKVIGIRTA